MNTEEKKVSTITVDDIANYLRLTEVTESDQAQLATSLSSAKSYIKGQTGLTDEEMDTFPELIQAVYLLCADMYDNRSLYVGKMNLNKAIDSLLGMHRRNFIPEEEESKSND